MFFMMMGSDYHAPRGALSFPLGANFLLCFSSSFISIWKALSEKMVPSQQGPLAYCQDKYPLHNPLHLCQPTKSKLLEHHLIWTLARLFFSFEICCSTLLCCVCNLSSFAWCYHQTFRSLSRVFYYSVNIFGTTRAISFNMLFLWHNAFCLWNPLLLIYLLKLVAWISKLY